MTEWTKHGVFTPVSRANSGPVLERLQTSTRHRCGSRLRLDVLVDEGVLSPAEKGDAKNQP